MQSLLFVLGTATTAIAASDACRFNSACYQPADVIQRDVAIIGGGATGTYSAITLSDEGKQVVVIEKEAVLGGHTNTYIDPATGTAVDYGVIAYWNTTLVQDFFARLDVALGPMSRGATNQTLHVDFQTGASVTDVVTSADLTGYQTQLQKYPYLLEGWDLPSPVPEDLLLPFGDFVTKYGLQDSAFTLYNAGAAGGLGSILEQLTVTVMKADSLAFMQELNGGVVTTAQHHNHQLYDNALQELGSNVLLQSTVVAAERAANESVKLVVRTASGTKLVIASQLLVTAPLTLDNMAPFALDPKERALFSQFQNTAYYCGLVSQTGLQAGASYVNTGADTPYHIPEFPSLYHVSPTAVDGLYSFWYGGDHTLVEAEVKANISATIQRLSGSNQPVEFVAFSSHTPFSLHVPAEAIADGFYTKLNRLQGHRNTWYTGALFTPSAATVWDFTRQLLPSIISRL
ncbi:FAD/NAD(P)-binding-domain-containing protein [Aspergillus terreus]|uniref:FAD/NAD(P)-binding-domain-containing protein n=1 Tax=Aspergillus terreus TaxID=33178 RepID=A0A5M3Z0F3_ASPTE|nr:hypothetical protein ATETN484_0006023500 [Aspergillus terreus]GFF19975.1 FAD/NAD(P)-binding-domain-containing protein [Aspergillus terreus]